MRNKRSRNMDGLLLGERKVGGSAIRLGAVCDGVGGTRDGAYAAAETLKALNSWFDGLRERERLGIVFLNEVKKVNEQISRDIQARCMDAATTCSAILLTQEDYYIVHTGDSRIYGWDQGNLVQLTRDGVSEEGRLSSYLGRIGSARLDYQEGKNRMDFYMLCSDGLYKRMDLGFLREQLESLSPKNMKKIEDRLVDHVVARGEKDNITVAFLLNEGWGKNEY